MKGRLALPAALAALAVTPLAFANHPNVSPRLGTPVHDAVFDREIVLKAGGKWANVNRNETIKFVAGNGSFIWRFDTYGTPIVDLRSIAPAGLIGESTVQVYVAEDPAGISGP